MIPLVGLNHCQPKLHMSQRIVNCYSTDETINPFLIGYMINPSLNCNKLFRLQVEKYLSSTFHSSTMKIIRYFLKNNKIWGF